MDDWFFIATIVVLSLVVGFVGGVAWVWYIAGGPSFG
jgi:hypothetical protein